MLFLLLFQAILPVPSEYGYHVCSYEDLGGDKFSTIVRTSSTNEEEVKKWLLDFQASSLCTWRVRQTFVTSGRYVLFKVGQNRVVPIQVS